MLGMNEEAQKELKRVITFDPSNVIAQKILGDIMKEEGRIDAYQENYKKILEIDPLNEEIKQVIESFEEKPVKEEKVI
jgi:Tfp pilus assembly protein PilF